jgi:hypothetical protein
MQPTNLSGASARHKRAFAPLVFMLRRPSLACLPPENMTFLAKLVRTPFVR